VFDIFVASLLEARYFKLKICFHEKSAPVEGEGRSGSSLPSQQDLSEAQAPAAPSPAPYSSAPLAAATTFPPASPAATGAYAPPGSPYYAASSSAPPAYVSSSAAYSQARGPYCGQKLLLYFFLYSLSPSVRLYLSPQPNTV
jgi:hypothetical protein